jgi:hypothetical protein
VAVPVRQNLRMGAYLARQKLARREKFPLMAPPGGAAKTGPLPYDTEYVANHVVNGR